MALLVTKITVHVVDLHGNAVVLIRLDLRVDVGLRVDVDGGQRHQLVDVMSLADGDATDAGDALKLRVARVVFDDANGPCSCERFAHGQVNADLRAVVVHLELESCQLLEGRRVLRVRGDDPLAETLREGRAVTRQAVARGDLLALAYQPVVGERRALAHPRDRRRRRRRRVRRRWHAVDVEALDVRDDRAVGIKLGKLGSARAGRINVRLDQIDAV